MNGQPQDIDFWYLKRKPTEQLKDNITTDVVVIGGGMAGIHAAQAFNAKGLSVTLIEKNYCGAGASGKSSGFITPESELNLTHLIKLYDYEIAKKLWDFVTYGCDLIQKNIDKYNINCDYQKQDSLVVANSQTEFLNLKTEHNNRIKLGYKSDLYNKEELTKIIGSNKYYGGLLSYDTFGISAYLYCQAMKENLQTLGVQIYEDTPAIRINSNSEEFMDSIHPSSSGTHHERDLIKGSVETPHATITAKYIIVCVDRFLPELNILKNEVFHAQNFILLSEPLTDEEIKKIFPQKNLMVWDTDLLYQYFRLADGNRLMIGGSDLVAVFWGKEQHNLNRMFKKLNNYIKKKFPDININFNYFWPGLIGVSKDIVPIACADKNNHNIYYISAATGLPWAAALGWYSAERIFNNNHSLDNYFLPDRKYPVNNFVQHIIGKRLTFGLSNLIVMYFKK